MAKVLRGLHQNCSLFQKQNENLDLMTVVGPVIHTQGLFVISRVRPFSGISGILQGIHCVESSQILAYCTEGIFSGVKQLICVVESGRPRLLTNSYYL